MTAANPTFPDGNQREIIFEVFSTSDAPSLKVAGAGELKMLWVPVNQKNASSPAG
jgi:hypothetical protein